MKISKTNKINILLIFKKNLMEKMNKIKMNKIGRELISMKVKIKNKIENLDSNRHQDKFNNLNNKNNIVLKPIKTIPINKTI